MLEGKKALESRLVGEAAAETWSMWNRHWTDAILTAVSQNPRKRILALTGIENRHG